MMGTKMITLKISTSKMLLYTPNTCLGGGGGGGEVVAVGVAGLGGGGVGECG